MLDIKTCLHLIFLQIRYQDKAKKRLRNTSFQPFDVNNSYKKQ